MYYLYYLAVTLLSLLITGAVMGMGPLILAYTRKKAITKRNLRIFCFLYTLSLCLLDSLYCYCNSVEYTTGFLTPLLWGLAFYAMANRILYRRGLLQ